MDPEEWLLFIGGGLLAWSLLQKEDKIAEKQKTSQQKAAILGDGEGQKVEGTAMDYSKYDMIIDFWRDDLDRNLIKGIIQAESSFDPQANKDRLGQAGVGLMGITLTTAKVINKREDLGVTLETQPEALLIPSINIHFGCRILLESWGRLQDWDQVIAEYRLGRPDVVAAARYLAAVRGYWQNFSERGTPT